MSLSPGNDDDDEMMEYKQPALENRTGVEDRADWYLDQPRPGNTDSLFDDWADKSDEDRMVAVTVFSKLKKARVGSRDVVYADIIDHDEWKMATFAERKRMQRIQDIVLSNFSARSTEFRYKQATADQFIGAVRRMALITRQTPVPAEDKEHEIRWLYNNLFPDKESARYKRKGKETWEAYR